MPEGAGYSGTPLPRKLGIGDGDELALIGAPDRFEDALGELPHVASVHTDLADDALILLERCLRFDSLEIVQTRRVS